MPAFPDMSVRQPQPHDIVDDPIDLCGVGTAFEAVAAVRVRDGNGASLTRQSIRVGGTGTWVNFHVSINVPGIPSTPNGTVEVLIESARDGSEIVLVTVPVVFGRALIDPYHGFAQHTVVAGDTLSRIAREFYGDPAQFRRIFQANRDQLNDPNVIRVGQTLRVPV
jgi:nucleoid-associated protein YgaU